MGMPRLVSKVNFNKWRTILTFVDNSKLIVNVTDSDKGNFNPQYGFLLAYFQKLSGLSKTEANKFLDSLTDVYELSKQKEKDKIKNKKEKKRKNKKKKKKKEKDTQNF